MVVKTSLLLVLLMGCGTQNVLSIDAGQDAEAGIADASAESTAHSDVQDEDSSEAGATTDPWATDPCFANGCAGTEPWPGGNVHPIR